MEYWLTVITANPNRYTSCAYYVLLHDVVNWTLLLQNLMFTMGMSGMFSAVIVLVIVK